MIESFLFEISILSSICVDVASYRRFLLQRRKDELSHIRTYSRNQIYTYPIGIYIGVSDFFLPLGIYFGMDRAGLGLAWCLGAYLAWLG
jgi:hypothetical protein